MFAQYLHKAEEMSFVYVRGWGVEAALGNKRKRGSLKFSYVFQGARDYRAVTMYY